VQLHKISVYVHLSRGLKYTTRCVCGVSRAAPQNFRLCTFVMRSELYQEICVCVRARATLVGSRPEARVPRELLVFMVEVPVVERFSHAQKGVFRAFPECFEA
jgi:hypothetical protein